MNMKIDDWCINERKKRIVRIYEGKRRREREREWRITIPMPFCVEGLR